MFVMPYWCSQRGAPNVKANSMCLQFGCFWTNGQICSATSRVLVQESIADAFYAQLKKRAESIPIGDPASPDTRLGPVVSESQYKKIMAFIEVRLHCCGCVNGRGHARAACSL